MKSARWKLGFYNALLVVGAPVLLLKKAVKFGRRGHRHEWDLARWTAPVLGASTQEGDKKRVVLVALSWGEVGILAQLTARLESELPGLKILWSIRDRAAQEMARRQFPNREIMAMPFDFSVAVENWLGAVRPDVLIVVEKFWWPNLVWGAKMRGARVVLINGRSRGREKTRYKWISGFQKWVLSGFDWLLFESESQIERVREVLPRGAHFEATGNIKFAFSAPTAPPGAASLEAWISGAGAPLLIAGSTSPIDEKWALDAFEIVKKEVPCALLIAPRRIDRADEVARQIEARGLVLSRCLTFDANRKTEKEAATGNGPMRQNPFAEVFLLDTLGELSWAYRFGVAAYVGGAVEGRGHNIIEPLAHGIAVSYGQNRGDFEAVQCATEAMEVGTRLENQADLAAFWRRALQDENWRSGVAIRASQLLAQNANALEMVIAVLSDAIAGISPK